ncbi:ABC transporter ATP-binding protein/permease [Litorivicinus sp.]|nr:ABC transporter ATP-binding protein/permease [Litorivicinus sp.]MDC1239976.1 ABC transporter ATP-binding protein/permease [Litorivicinus sp.]
MGVAKKLWDLLAPDERRRAVFILLMTVVMALIDMVGVASILPFMAVLANPSVVETNPIINLVYTAIDVRDPTDFLFLLGVIVLVFLVTSLVVKAFTTYIQLRFAQMREYSIGTRLMEGYLNQPYSWFLNQNSADLGKKILNEVSVLVHQNLIPVMIVISQTIVACTLLTLLLLVDVGLAITVGSVLGLAYFFLFRAVSGFLARIGGERIMVNQRRFAIISEAFSAAKEIKVCGLEKVFVGRFAGPAQSFARYSASASVVGQLPRYALEAIAFGGLVLIVLFLMDQSGSFSSVIPIVSLYAFAGYRLMPALQQIYGALTQLRFAGPVLDSLHSDLMSLRQIQLSQGQKSVTFQKMIELDNIFYTYPGASQPALRGLCMTIPWKSTVGFVGSTGSGKTTTVDLILGLLEAQQGTMQVDGQIISGHNIGHWRSSIGYVPQQIYLLDDSIEANIAFGVDKQKVNQELVEYAAGVANLHDFVANELDDGYQTFVGERGVRLSGGERQRIGIARALYHRPQILILDEATSALDNLTERAVMGVIRKLSNEMTIILVAHRLSTIRECDQIFLFRDGQIEDSGRYSELVETSERFRNMADTS